jgi:PAS domain S-box-containing protein
MTTVLIIGSCNGSRELLEILAEQIGITVSGVVDKDSTAPAVVLARQLNIPTGPDQREFFKNKIDIIINLSSQKEIDYDLELMKDSGTEVIGESSARLICSLLKNAKDAMRKAAFQSTIISQVRNAIVVSNRKGEVQYWSKGAEDLFQWRAVEATGRSFFNLVLPEDRKADADDLLATAMFEGFWQGEIVAQKKDGALFSVLMSNSALSDDSRDVCLISISSDITEQKKAEAAFRSETGFRKAIEDAVLPGIVAYDPEGGHLYVNKGFCRIVGWSEEELKGLHPPFPYWPPEEMEPNASALQDILKGTEGTGKIELTFCRRNGERFHALVLTAPFNDEYGHVKGWVSSISDITGYKQREERACSLSQQLRELAYYLEMEREAERKETARRIHDEIAQPLAAVKLELSSLGSKLEDRQKLLDRMRVMNVIIDEGIKSVKRICVELRPWLLDDMGAAEAIEWQIMEFEKRTAIEYRLNISSQETIPDRDLSTTIFRIFQEILRNVELHAKAATVYVDFSVRQDEVVLEVRDDGIGIDEGSINNPRSYGLMGIRERVLTWGGSMEITGEHNKGTTIIVRIPLPK